MSGYTIRYAILTCARKPTCIRLIYRTETTTKKCKNRKKTKKQKRICSEVTVKVLKKIKKGCGGKDLQKGRF